MTPAVAEVFAYLKITQPPTEGVVVLPNLLHAYWRGYGPRVGDLSYVVMGPAVEPNVGLIQHEAMHPILNPLVDAHLGAVELGQADRLTAALKPQVAAGYRTWPNMLHESVIRAVEVRLPPADRERLIRQEEAAGFPLVRPLAGRLADYEASGQALAEFMPRLWLCLTMRRCCGEPAREPLPLIIEKDGSMRNIRLIFVEGLPGLGKTTTASWLASRLPSQRLVVNLFEEHQLGHPLNVGGDLHPAGIFLARPSFSAIRLQASSERAWKNGRGSSARECRQKLSTCSIAIHFRTQCACFCNWMHPWISSETMPTRSKPWSCPCEPCSYTLVTGTIFP